MMYVFMDYLRLYLNVCMLLFLIAALLCVFRPNAFGWDEVVGLSPVERLEHAFTVAKDQLAIERLLDAEGTTRPSGLKHSTCVLHLLELFGKK